MARFNAKLRELDALTGRWTDNRRFVVYYVLNGVERGTIVPPGGDRWDAVAHAISRLLGRDARADEPPTYDRGTRHWTLPVRVAGRWRRTQVMQVAVRWGMA